MKRLYVLSKDIWRFNGFSFSIVICIFNCINQNLRDYKIMYITGMNGNTSYLHGYLNPNLILRKFND